VEEEGIKFKPGDEVIVVEGTQKGQYGLIVQYEATFGKYFVDISDESPAGYFAFSESELEALDGYDEVTEISIPAFGVSSEVMQTHLEWLMTRSLERLGEIGPEQALFGFQEFEGKTAQEVLLELMGKLEEGMALFGQAHILIGRVVVALESVEDQSK